MPFIKWGKIPPAVGNAICAIVDHGIQCTEATINVSHWLPKDANMFIILLICIYWNIKILGYICLSVYNIKARANEMLHLTNCHCKIMIKCSDYFLLALACSRYLLHYVLSYAHNRDAVMILAGVGMVCLLVALIGTGIFQFLS